MNHTLYTKTILWVAALAFLSGCGNHEGDNDLPTFRVERGPLNISISQSGTMKAQEQEIITSQVQGRTTIINLIEEGSRVSEGDLLVELDASALQDKLVDQNIHVQNAEANFIRSRENLAVVKNKSKSDISKAELDYRFAQEDLQKYIEGEYKQQLRQAESKITLAQEELQLSSQKLEWSEKLFAENYISQSERDSDELAFKRSKLDLELAIAAKELLEEFTYKRQIAQLESDVEQTKMALERINLRTHADVIQAEADLNAKQAGLRQQESKRVKLEDQISKTKIYAPRNGLVVYATSAKANWRGNEEPLEAGQEVREKQELIYLPTADLMKTEVQIHESNLDKIKLGQPAVLTVDALQGKTFTGSVSRIAPLPDAASMWMNPDLKVYRTEITIPGKQPDLRTGMSCMAEILIDQYEDALFVPVQAVIKLQNKDTVFVKSRRSYEPVQVQTGLDNNRMIHILSGLKDGQEVLLAPPLDRSDAVDTDFSTTAPQPENPTDE